MERGRLRGLFAACGAQRLRREKTPFVTLTPPAQAADVERQLEDVQTERYLQGISGGRSGSVGFWHVLTIPASVIQSPQNVGSGHLLWALSG